MSTKIKLSSAKIRVKWMRESKIFTVRALWNAVREIESNELEIYWDYSCGFSNDQLEEIEDDGYEGLDKAYEELWDLNSDSMEDDKSEQIKELISNLKCEDFKKEYLLMIKNNLVDEEMIEAEDSIEDVLEIIKSDFDDYIDDEDFVDCIREYQIYDVNLDGLFSNTTYKRIPWATMDVADFKEYIQDEIDVFSKRNKLENLEIDENNHHETFRFPSTNAIPSTLDEMVQVSDSLGNNHSVVNLGINNRTIYLIDEDGEQYELEINKIVEVPLSHLDITMEDEDEYVDDQWDDVMEMEIITPSKEDREKLSILMIGLPVIGYYSDEADIQCQIESLLVIEGEFQKADKYKVFGLNIETGQWCEQLLTPSSITNSKVVKNSKELQGMTIALDGKINNAVA